MGRMAEQQRKLLEQMMGPEAMGITTVTYDWWHDKVCRNFLFGKCPHIVFSNTRMDLGPCPKVHSDKVVDEFNQARNNNPNDPRIAAFRQEHENTIYGYVDDADRKIRASQRKLEKTPEENRKTVDLMREIGEIELSIQGGTEEIEALGEAGKVEESMEKLAAVDALKNMKTEKERDLQQLNETAGASGHQKLRVCEICGAMLSVLDSDKRLADHFGGKLHLGYHELRQYLAKMAEERMTGRVAAAPPPNAPAAPSGPRGQGSAPSFAPSGPSNPPVGPSSGVSGGGYRPNGGSFNGYPAPESGNGASPPRTPLDGPKVPPLEEMPHIGHGDKLKREAGELIEDIKEERSNEPRESERDREREREREKERDSAGRSRDERRERDRYVEKDREREEGEEEGRSRRHRDKDREDRYERYERSERHSERSDRDRDRSDRYDKYDDKHRPVKSSRYDERDRRRERERGQETERSRSPQKRRLV